MSGWQPCDRVHASDEVRVAGSRFALVPMFQAQFDGAPIRATRAEAKRDMCQHWQEKGKP